MENQHVWVVSKHFLSLNKKHKKETVQTKDAKAGVSFLIFWHRNQQVNQISSTSIEDAAHTVS